MNDGQRWLALDADLMGKPFTLDLYDRFGWAGVGVWVAFLCACKRSRTPGSIRFLSEADARAQLGILGLDLVDNEGAGWSLDDFWTHSGRKKQTKRTLRGRETNVKATHWQRWQKRTSHGKNTGTRGPLARAEAGADLDLDLDLDTPLPPRGGQPGRFAQNGKPQNPDARPVIPDWQPDPEPADVIDPAAVANLRANPGGKQP